MEITRQVIETNPNPIYVKNESGKFVLANSAYAILQGLSVEELLAAGASEMDYAHERDLEILATGETANAEEFYRLKNGNKIWYQTTKKVIAQEDGSNYLFSVSSDITAWKEKLEVATASAKAKDTFLSNMTNEIVTPINAILGMARLIKQGFLNKAQDEYLHIILSIADNLLSMPTNILDYAKINSGELTVESIPFNVSSTVRDTVRALTTSANEQGLQLHFKEGTESMPVLEGDPFRLSQILVNLIKNAIKFTKRGEITVSVDLVERDSSKITLEFCVEDTGIGMTEEKFEQLLKNLNQPNSSNSPLFAGTGLGLCICKGLIEAQGGRIWVESEHGQGSRFNFELPFLISEKDSPEEVKPLSQVIMKNLELLLVEDNQVNQLLTVSQLKEYDINVDLALDGEDALAKTTRKAYDLILMDIQLPTLDGIEATSRIRREYNLNNSTPIVAFTANAHKIDLGKYKSAGFTDYLLKPYNKSSLFHLISKYTGKTVKLKPVRDNLIYKTKQTPLYDFSGLGDLANDAAFIRRMQQLFVDTVPGQLQELKEAIQHKDWDLVTGIAHRLKSTFGNIKVSEATSVLKKMEHLARTRTDLHQLEDLYMRVHGTTDKVINVFSQMLQVES